MLHENVTKKLLMTLIKLVPSVAFTPETTKKKYG